MSPQQVHFDSQGIKIAALLWVPSNTAAKENAAIVVSHPMGGVKEQTASLYAEKLSQLGFITLAFDAAYQGASEGTPRYLEDPFHRAEDIKNAVTYFSTLPQVNAKKIGALGICASGGYVPYAAQTDRRIKAVGCVSAVDAGALFRDGFHNSISEEELNKTLAQANQDRTDEANGATPRTVPIIPTAEYAATLPDKALFKEAYDYYGTPRAQHERAPGVYLGRSIDLLAQFHAYDYIKLISPRPLLFIAGSIADTLYYSQEALEKASEPKELFLIKDATHIDLYDKLQFVDPAVEKLNQFFTQNL